MSSVVVLRGGDKTRNDVLVRHIVAYLNTGDEIAKNLPALFVPKHKNIEATEQMLNKSVEQGVIGNDVTVRFVDEDPSRFPQTMWLSGWNFTSTTARKDSSCLSPPCLPARSHWRQLMGQVQ